MENNLLSLSTLDKEDFDYLLTRALELKQRHEQNISDLPLAGKTVGLIFEKPSTRTRISFEVATSQLGGASIFISSQETQMSRDEPIKDTARVLSNYLDCLVIRTYAQKIIEEFENFSTIPVINALTDLYHPCQILSDLITVVEYKGGYKGLKIAWVGDGNNVANSWINAAGILDLNLVLACPENYLPNPEIIKNALAAGKGKVEIVADPVQAVKNADVIYTDVWASMGQEEELGKKKQLFKPFQVNSKLVSMAAKDAIIMHCLPAHRGEEISDKVMEGEQSVIWDQSENKLHMHKAILETFL